MRELIGQLIGIVGTVIAVLSFQCKDNRRFFIWQAACGACFALNFLLLGSLTSALLHFFNIFRAVFFGFTKGRTRSVLAVGVGLLFVISTVLTFGGLNFAGIMSVLALLAQLAGTTAMYFDNGKVIRITQLSFVSPIWLINSILSQSVGAILCEVFNICSIVVSLIRFGSDGFTSVGDTSTTEKDRKE